MNNTHKDMSYLLEQRFPQELTRRAQQHTVGKSTVKGLYDSFLSHRRVWMN